MFVTDYQDPFQFVSRPDTEMAFAALMTYDLLQAEDEECSPVASPGSLGGCWYHWPIVSSWANSVEWGPLYNSGSIPVFGTGSKEWRWGTSASWQLSCGVLQGTLQSPVLFNIYLKLLGEVMKNVRVWCHQ